MVDGHPLADSYHLEPEDLGLTGLALGLRDAQSYRELTVGARLPILSCACGAYDCRVVATVVRKGAVVMWKDLVDIRSEATIAALTFDASQYEEALKGAIFALERRLPWYRLRLVLTFRDDGMPLGAGSVLDIALGLLFLLGLAASQTGNLQGWTIMGLVWWGWAGLIVLLSVTIDLIRRKVRGGDVWLDGPIHTSECKWHERIRFLYLNYRRSYGLFRFRRDNGPLTAAD